eukprot:m.62438 g.62438  ORF g.62438 m.62438 type:complete len:392 (+) comp11403_c0_seq1:877-2052(+)
MLLLVCVYTHRTRGKCSRRAKGPSLSSNTSQRQLIFILVSHKRTTTLSERRLVRALPSLGQKLAKMLFVHTYSASLPACLTASKTTAGPSEMVCDCVCVLVLAYACVLIRDVVFIFPAACIASGRFLGCYKEESSEYLDKFLDRFFHHLSDNIWSVRENAAIAIGRVCENFEERVLPKVVEVLDERILAARDQKEDSQQFSGLENTTQFGVAKPTGIVRFSQTDPTPDVHTDQQMYSCGSLAPKLKKRGGGCMNCAYSRDQQPWEKSDGCVYLLTALSEKYPETVAKYLPSLAQLSTIRQFKHHYNMLENIWKQLPVIMTRVKKKEVKAVLEELIPSLAYSLRGDHQLSRVAAESCTHALASLIGRNILKGRVDMYTPEHLSIFEAVIGES